MVPSTLQQVTDEVRRLRHERGKRVHLPDPLRESVARLASERDVSAVSRDLGITRNTIAKWMKRYPAPSRSRSPAPQRESPVTSRAAVVRPEPIAFFEITTSPAPAASRASDSAASSIELARPDGMTLRLSGELVRELAVSILDRFTTTGGTR